MDMHEIVVLVSIALVTIGAAAGVLVWANRMERKRSPRWR